MQKVIINADICKGCGLCNTACPKGLISLAKDTMNAKGFHPARFSDNDKCISCAFCAMMCPETAISVYKEG